jgi:hypothetical protein
MFRNYDGVLKVDGEVGYRKTHGRHRRSCLTNAEQTRRPGSDLRGNGKTMFCS